MINSNNCNSSFKQMANYIATKVKNKIRWVINNEEMYKFEESDEPEEDARDDKGQIHKKKLDKYLTLTNQLEKTAIWPMCQFGCIASTTCIKNWPASRIGLQT